MTDFTNGIKRKKKKMLTSGMEKENFCMPMIIPESLFQIMKNLIFL